MKNSIHRQVIAKPLRFWRQWIELGTVFSLSVAVLSAPRANANQNFVVSPSTDAIKFTSDAPVEVIVGHTNKISGNVTVLDDLSFDKTFTATFKVDLASIDTGIPLRNEHMRDNFLETKKFPLAVLYVSKVTGDVAAFKDGRPTKTTAEGELTIHGVTVKREIPVTVTMSEDGHGTRRLSIKSEFPVKLADHNIKRPQVVFSKLADTIFVKVAAQATSAN
ncbi:MAG TPA: YceI family protein [Oculatellaceae cyanobacterium]